MIAFGLTLTLTFGGGWTLDINPRLVLGGPTAPNLPNFAAGGYPSCGFAIPHLAVIDTDCPNVEALVAHEVGHLDQYDALGPGFLAAYALTGGQAIEDYLGPPGSTWFPAEGEARCPLVRIEPHHSTFMPCWRPS